MPTSRSLLAFAYIAERFEKTGDIRDGLITLFAPVIARRKGKRFSPEEFAADVREMYDIEMHPYVAEDFATRLAAAVGRGSERTMRAAVAMCALTALLPSSAPPLAQTCPPERMYLIVRGENQAVLSESELKAIQAQSPPPLGDDDTRMVVGWLDASADGRYVIPPEGHRESLAVLYFDGRVHTCALRLKEVSLARGPQRMRLVFDVTMPFWLRTGDRLKSPPFFIVNSLPFQDGTFELHLDRWLAGLKEPTAGEVAPFPVVGPEYWKRTQ